ncbi:MAG: hypothetical protein JWP89_2653 [Schlesneria sp.]|nr:hypothetical protein [Schlesneria sp.]
MENVTTIAGQAVTVGTVATLLAQWVKGLSWFPRNAFLIRTIVAAVCVGLSAGVTFVQGQPLDYQTLLNAFFSYTVAATAYDHLFRTV